MNADWVSSRLINIFMFNKFKRSCLRMYTLNYKQPFFQGDIDLLKGKK